MIKNYILIAWRNLAKQKGLSFISIFGLSLGIACFSLFLLYAINEFNFDGFHKNADNIYLVLNSNDKASKKDIGGWIFTPMALGPAMKRELTGVENYVRYIQPFETFIKINNEGRRENISYADPSFFSVFSFKLKYGNAVNPLGDMHSIVLTEETAKRLFGKANAVGESFQVKIENVFEPFIVTAIAEQPPSNSSFQFTMLAGFDRWASTTEGKLGAEGWGWNSYMTLVQLKAGSTLAENGKTLSEFAHRHNPKVSGSHATFDLEPLRDLHTNNKLLGIKIAPVDPKQIWILLIIAAGVLLIACINFTTLAIGRSATRAKEVGVRKVIGGTKKQLMLQFLAESILLTIFSTIAGLVLANLLLPFYNQLAGRQLIFSLVQFPQLIGLIAGMIFIAAILSGCYPALVLSNFNAVTALKTKIKLGGANFFTKSLVIFQFVLSAGLIISAVIIMEQLHYMQSKNPGFDKENVVSLKVFGISNTKNIYPLFKHELAAHPEIVASASADNGLGEREGMAMTGINHDGESIVIAEYCIDPNYIPTLGMHLLSGRNFKESISSDTVNTVIINEALMNQYGWTPEKCIGQPLDGYNNRGMNNPTVIGVVKNFNYLGLQQKIEPQIFLPYSYSVPYHFFVRIRPGNPAKALATIQSVWKKILPEYPLRYNFVDEDLDRFYKSEARLSNIIGWAGGISIFLACLGLLGLAALAVINRTKEIGIRKVLGASLSTIIQLISKDFIQLVAIALLIATPLVWYLMNNWLQDYAYRINIDWWIFFLIDAIIIGLALITVFMQSIKAAMANPFKSLRTE